MRYTLGEDPERKAAGWPHFTVVSPEGEILYTGGITECERRLADLNRPQIRFGPFAPWGRRL